MGAPDPVNRTGVDAPSRAIRKTVQWVASPGGASRVRGTTHAITSSRLPIPSRHRNAAPVAASVDRSEAPTRGAKNNPDGPPLLRERAAPGLPAERIMLRSRQDVWDKTRRLRVHRQQGIFAEPDCTVIALVSGARRAFIEALEHPRILNVLLPIGVEHLIIERAANQVDRVEHDCRGELMRANGPGIRP